MWSDFIILIKKCGDNEVKWYLLFTLDLYQGLHDFEEGLNDLSSQFRLKKGVIMVKDRLKLSYYTFWGHQNHSMVFETTLQI